MMLDTFVSLPGIPGSDPSRIGAQVVSGGGFLGAGTNIRGRRSIHGLTSAATIWVAAAVGVTCGGGHRRFLMEVWRLRGVESVRYQDGTIPSLPRHADDVASETTGNSSGK